MNSCISSSERDFESRENKRDECVEKAAPRFVIDGDVDRECEFLLHFPFSKALSIEIAIDLEFLIATHAFLDYVSLSLSPKFSNKMNLNWMDPERHFVNVFLVSCGVFLGSANLNALSEIANDLCFSIFFLLIVL